MKTNKGVLLFIALFITGFSSTYANFCQGPENFQIGVQEEINILAQNALDNGNTSLQRISVRGNSTTLSGAWVQNPDFWLKDIDFSGFSVWNSRSSDRRNGTLVTPRHMIFSDHFFPLVGNTVSFLDTSGNLYTRTVEDLQMTDQYGIYIAQLDSDLPDSVEVYKTLSLETLSSITASGSSFYMINTGGYSGDYYVWNASAESIISPDFTSHFLSTGPDFPIFSASGSNISTPASDFVDGIIGGDSSSPAFMLYNGELLLLGSLARGDNLSASGAYMWGGITDFPYALDDINAKIDEMSGGSGDYQFETYSETCHSPTLDLIGDTVLQVVKGSSYEDLGAQANDEEDGDISENIVLSGSVDTNTLGLYTLTYNITDSAGNTSSLERTVEVILGTPPSITLNGDAFISTYKGSSYTDLGAQANDEEDGDISENIVLSGSVDTSTLGTYTLSYSISDISGNTANVERIVEVGPGNTPVITLNGAETIQLKKGSSYTDLGAQANDEEDGDISGNIVMSGSVDTNTLGTYTLSYSISDISGNTASISRQVIIIKSSGGGSSSGGIKYDKCPNGDTSGSIYDGKCKPTPVKNQTSSTTSTGNTMTTTENEAIPVSVNTKKKIENKEIFYTTKDYTDCSLVHDFQNADYSFSQNGVFLDENTFSYKNTVLKMKEMGIVRGYENGMFFAHQNVSRIEFLKILLRLNCYDYSSEDTSTISDIYSDISPDLWEAKVVKKSHELGIISGYSDGTFRPNQEISKSEAMKILLGVAELEVENPELLMYTDISSDWQVQYVEMAQSIGIISPERDSYHFSPEKGIQREEMLELIGKLVQLY